jgi:NADPH2 dehydrogenase
VAHFFKFHSVAKIRDECSRLGIDLRFSEDLTPLFQSAQVGFHRVGNRFCVQPMEGCDGTLEGAPDELVFRRYQRFGAGGAKLIWGEAAAVADEGRANPRQLWINEKNADGFARLVDVCRAAHRQFCGKDSDFVVGLQLTHSGRYSFRKPLLACHDPLLDARMNIDSSYPLLTDDDLKRLVDLYVRAAKIARRAGFQFIDIKQCHRYLLNELLAARTRSGPYGGVLENRTRLAREIIEAICAAVPELMIASRLNVYDGIPFRRQAHSATGEPSPFSPPLECGWGTNPLEPYLPDLTEPIVWIGEMMRLGVAMVNVSLGNPYASPHLIRPYEYPPPDGYDPPEHPLIGVARHVELTAAIQMAYPNLPVVGSGYSYLQEFLPHVGAANIRDGRATFVGVGRATLAQPDFVRQIESTGKLDRKRVCRTFSYCTALMRAKHNDLGQFATGCPPFDKEVYGPLWDAAKIASASRR